jgi:type IV pilus assembly protein PilY1
MYRHTKVGPGETPFQTRLFQFDPLPSSPDANPVRGRPTYAYSADKTVVWIYYGTGRFESEADKTSVSQQYFFGIKDLASGTFSNVAPTYTQNSSTIATLTTAIETVTVGAATKKVRTVSGTNADGKSWALKLYVPASGGSERSFTKALVVGGIVFFTTYIPESGACGGSGDTYVFALDYKTGLPPAYPVFDINDDKKFTDADKVTINGVKKVPAGIYVGKGQGSTPVLFKDTLFVTTTLAQSMSAGEGSGGLHAIAVNLADHRIRVESWKHN